MVARELFPETGTTHLALFPARPVASRASLWKMAIATGRPAQASSLAAHRTTGGFSANDHGTKPSTKFNSLFMFFLQKREKTLCKSIF
jgi:hypothetical protein